MKLRSILFAPAALLVACSAHGTTPSAASGSGLQAAAPAKAHVSITLPAVANGSAQRRTQYVSPYTLGLAITVYPSPATPPPAPTIVADVSPASAYCNANVDGSRSCEIPLAIFPGTYDVLVQAYDEVPQNATTPQGTLLSQGTVDGQTIQANTDNSIAVTMDGAIASLELGPQHFTPLANGEPQALSLYVNAKDAEGATIVGPGNYTVPVSLTLSGDANDTLTVPSQIASPSGATVSIAYNGGTLTSGSITASAGAIHSNTATVTPLHADGVVYELAPGQTDTITASQASWTGPFQAASTNTGCATVSPASATPASSGAPVTFTVTGVGSGTCSITISTDASTSLSYTVGS